jgi:hypothetical protein
VSDADQVWTLEHDGHTHRVEASGSASHQVRWLLDGEQIAEKKAWEEKLTLVGGERGTVVVRFSTLGKARRATLFGPEEDAQALAGLGGIDLVPTAGSSAAAYEDRVRLHPQRYAAIATVGGVAKVVIPLLLGLLAVRFAVRIDWPDLPIPNLPDLPDIPWPDLPSVPFPDLPDPRLPDWVRWLLDKVKYVWPILLAYVLARAEINRRRKQDELRRAQDDS